MADHRGNPTVKDLFLQLAHLMQDHAHCPVFIQANETAIRLKENGELGNDSTSIMWMTFSKEDDDGLPETFNVSDTSRIILLYGDEIPDSEQEG